jgi:ABC-type transport system involved in multi-copper enzyme maturation permease subunit
MTASTRPEELGQARRAKRWSLASAVSGAVLLREAARSSRRWQTYGARTAFSGILLGLLLMGMWSAVGMSRSGAIDTANLAWLGRYLFIGFSVVQTLLAIVIAPITTASAVIEETDERTMEMLVLTPLAPGQILGAKVLSRILILLTLVCGALPVMAMVVNLGGVGTYEVVAVTVHTLTTVVLMAALGAFFGLFTRSPALAMMASASYAVPFFGILPAAYTILAGGAPARMAQFSTFAAGLADGPAAWVTPLSFLPSVVLIMALATPLFQLRVSNADVRHAFSDGVWRTTTWIKASGALVVVAIPTVPFAASGAYAFASPKGSLGVALEIASVSWLWLLFSALGALGTWAFLRVGTDVVDGLDGLLSGSAAGPQSTRASLTVWANPVMWREGRPRAWGATATPMLVTWGLLMLATFQTGWWLFPGGVLAIGAGNVAAAVLFAAWLGARSVAEERRRGTLEVLVASTLPPARIVSGKLAGALLPTVALLVPGLPLLAIGVPHLRMMIGQGAVSWIGWGLLGIGYWVWALPVWVLATGLAMTAATTAARSRSAFPVVAIGLVGWFGAPAVLARAFPQVPWVVVPCHLVSPPLAGSTSLIEIAASTVVYGILAAAVLGVYTRKMRAWVGALAALLALAGALSAPIEAGAAPDPEVLAKLEELNRIRMRARPLADGLSREGRFTSVSVWIENAGDDTVGTLSLGERAADGTTTTTYARRVELPQGGRKQVQLLLAPGIGGPERVLDLTTRDGRIGMAPFQLQPLAASAVAIAVVGADPLGLPATVRDATGEPVPGRVHRPGGDPRRVATGVVAPEDLPAVSAGYQGIDWVVWPAADPTAARAEQAEALRGWVADGGHLLITVSDQWRQVAASPLADALPVTLEGVRDDDVTDLARVLLGASSGRPAPIAVGALRLDRSPAVRARTPGGDPLWVSAPYGLGSVHLVLTDLDGLGPVRQSERAWRMLLTLPPPGGFAADQLALERGGVARAVHAMLNLDPVDPPESGPDAWEATMRDRLGDIPGVAPLPMSWLVAFSVVYLLAIGPLDYLVLRVLRRQPATWITFPAMIVVFSGASLAMTSYTKGSQAMVVRVDVVDLLPDARLARGATWLGVFSTRKTELALQAGYPDAVVAPLAEPGFQSDIRVSAGAGPGELRYAAETWTLAYARSDWMGPMPGGLEVLPAEQGWTVVNRLGFDLDDLAVQIPEEPGGAIAGSIVLGALADGASVPLPSLTRDRRGAAAGDLAWALEALAADRPEVRGALGGAHRPVLVGVARRTVEPVVLTGLDPVEQPLTVVRMPLPGGVDGAEGRAVLGDELGSARAALTCGGVEVPGAVRVEGRVVRWRGSAGTAPCRVALEGSDWQVTLPAPMDLAVRCGREATGVARCAPEGG